MVNSPGLPMFDGADEVGVGGVVVVHHADDDIHEVVDVAERSRLAAVAVDGDVLAFGVPGR